jgi:predicted N-acetyltransferase YhbS
MMSASTYRSVRLRPARPEEAGALGALCLRSKAHWGYDAAFIDACREELSVGADAIAAGLVRVAEADGEVAGVVEIGQEDGAWHLEKLFVEPSRMARGVGRLLMEWAASEAAARGASEIVIESDPEAVSFYRRLGAVEAGSAPSKSIAGRHLPRLVLNLQEVRRPAGGR